MAGLQMVGVMAMVCWLAEIVALTGAAKGAEPVSSGSDSEARDEAPVGSGDVPDSGVEASVPDSGVVAVTCWQRRFG